MRAHSGKWKHHWPRPWAGRTGGTVKKQVSSEGGEHDRMRPRGRSGNPQAEGCKGANTNDQTRESGPKDLQSSSLRRNVLLTVFLSLVRKNPFQTLHAWLFPYSDLNYVSALWREKWKGPSAQCLLAELMRHLSVICLLEKSLCQDHFAVITLISSSF